MGYRRRLGPASEDPTAVDPVLRLALCTSPQIWTGPWSACRTASFFCGKSSATPYTSSNLNRCMIQLGRSIGQKLKIIIYKEIVGIQQTHGITVRRSEVEWQALHSVQLITMQILNDSKIGKYCVCNQGAE